MPPIQVYTKAPINAAKASGVTPQTAAPEGTDPNAPTHATTRTTATAAAPSSSPNHPSSGSQPTRTTSAPQQQPPPPQPGAVPRLPEPTGTLRAAPPSPQPPPPAPTAAPLGPTAATAAVQIPGVSYPPQMGIQPPQAAHNQRGTATAYAPPYNQSGGGGGIGGPGSQVDDEEKDEGFLGSAVKLAKAAGEKLSAAESEVWRRINGEGND
ncbi:hypothetical protein VTI28DRAFT_2491 [Corynascus sepedonium]